MSMGLFPKVRFKGEVEAFKTLVRCIEDLKRGWWWGGGERFQFLMNLPVKECIKGTCAWGPS